MDAWVEVSKIKEIANLSEVAIIRRVSLGLFNIDTVEIQRNATLHLKIVSDVSVIRAQQRHRKLHIYQM
ncbi:hypothetical protein DK846_06385 [Methanospirillum lacunae]|uniref:Uncharacterized protein n=1 Tax=Methanospirillum lacunae TaxID=668570 RepID=A0A2V2N1U5_9EURY|nr:hypothetical protein DK846_06385 [Methanospirillum lacunae]